MRLHKPSGGDLPNQPRSRIAVPDLSKFYSRSRSSRRLQACGRLLRGPFSFSIGMLPIRSADGWKALTIGIWGVAASAWLRDKSAKARSGSQTVATRHRWAIGAVVVMQLLFSLPIALPGFAPSHDATAHLTNSYLFHRALEQGQFPVRWVEWITPGNGQPLFSYYQVGFYYLVEIVRLAIGGLTTSVKVTLVAIWPLERSSASGRSATTDSLPPPPPPFSFRAAPTSCSMCTCARRFRN